MHDNLRPYLSRGVVGPIVAWVCAQILAHFGILVSPHAQQVITDICVVLAIYGLTHRAMDSKVNPVDAARINVAKTHSDQPQPQ